MLLLLSYLWSTDTRTSTSTVAVQTILRTSTYGYGLRTSSGSYSTVGSRTSTAIGLAIGWSIHAPLRFGSVCWVHLYLILFGGFCPCLSFTFDLSNLICASLLSLLFSRGISIYLYPRLVCPFALSIHDSTDSILLWLRLSITGTMRRPRLL